MFMSPSSMCEAATHPPAQVGMNAQSPHSFQGCSRSNLERGFAPLFAPVVDVSSRLRLVACKPRAGIQRPIRPDRVRMLHVHVTGAAVYPVRRREAAQLCFVSQERHLVGQIARATGRTGALAGGGHAAAAQRLAVLVDRQSAAGCPWASAAAAISRTTGLKFTPTSLSANS